MLHLLAQGGRIEIEKNESRNIASVQCLTATAGAILASTWSSFEN
jgi:uncharacterized protein YjhX (UPF0386 family)